MIFFFFKLNVITKHCGLIIKIKTHITCLGPSGAKLTLQTADMHPGLSEADRGLSFINKPYVVMQQQQQVNADPESYPVAQRLPRIGADLRAWLGIKCGLVSPGPRSTLPPTLKFPLSLSSSKKGPQHRQAPGTESDICSRESWCDFCCSNGRQTNETMITVLSKKKNSAVTVINSKSQISFCYYW